MAKVILDVPTEKMQSFLKAVLNLGIESRTMREDRSKKTSNHKRLRQVLKKMSSNLLLFDWEFFSNELEYE